MHYTSYEFSTNILHERFSKDFRLFYNQLKLLKEQNHKKVIIYGAGSIAELIAPFFKDKVVAFLDSNVDSLPNKSIDNIEIFHPDMLNTLQYDIIIISAMGYENEIVSFLQKNYQVSTDKIFSFNLLSEYEEILKILNQQTSMNKQKTILQIGASEGSLCHEFVFNGWKAYGFDANPKYKEDYNQLKNIQNLHLFNKAISIDEARSVTFYISEEHEGIGSLKSYHKTHSPIEVEAISLQEFYTEQHITAIDFFMIDAETMDLDIMKTHNWEEVPINSLVMECNRRNVLEIKEYILSKVPSYNYTVFAYEKPFGLPGEKGYCRGTASAEFFSTLPKNFFGNIFFWKEAD